MSSRREVFQEKVLKKLYPSPAQPKYNEVPPPSIESVVRQKTAEVVKAKERHCADGLLSPLVVGKKLYTVLPPPEGFVADAKVSLDISSSQTTCEDPDSEENDDVQEEEEDGPRRKRRRRRGRSNKASQESADDPHQREGVAGSEVTATAANTAERLSRNKKRKLKKKRHKEKLRGLGLVPQAAAVEFTFQQGAEGEEEEEEEEEQEEKEETYSAEKLSEVLEFLKTTLEIYMADHSCPTSSYPDGAETLLELLANGTAPSTDVVQLCALKELVRRRNMEELRQALEEFQNSTTLPHEEASAVFILFDYWIKDIFPLGEEARRK